MKSQRITKLGVDRSELAKRPKNLDNNFAQSRDVHGDRGTVQSRLGRKQNPLPAKLAPKGKSAPPRGGRAK